MKTLLGFQTLILGGGVFYTWTALMGLFREFYALYGTIFRVQDCAVTNPMLTACFYGSLGLLAAFIWSIILFYNYSRKSQQYLLYLLYFGVIFALLVVGYEFLEYYHIIPAKNAVTCKPGIFPLKTPCFYGMLFFLGAAISGRAILKRDHK